MIMLIIDRHFWKNIFREFEGISQGVGKRECWREGEDREREREREDDGSQKEKRRKKVWEKKRNN